MRNYKIYTKDILNAIESILKFTEGMNFEDFKKDDKTCSAVVRKLEVIGAAAKHIPQEIRDKFPLIPWKEMAGMRDRLIHFYFGIDYKLVWMAVNDRIPKILPLIKKVIEEI